MEAAFEHQQYPKHCSVKIRVIKPVGGWRFAKSRRAEAGTTHPKLSRSMYLYQMPTNLARLFRLMFCICLPASLESLVEHVM